MSEERKTGLGVIFLTVFMDLIGFSIIFPLLPSMLEHYLIEEGRTGLLGGFLDVLERLSATAGAGDDAAFLTTVLFGGLLGSLYAVLQFFFAPLWGQVSDRAGRRRILLITTTGTALSYVVWFFAGSFSLLVLSRFIGGVMGGNISVANAAVADVTSSKNRAKGMGLIGAAFGLGFILGPSLGGGLSLLDLSAGPLGEVPGVNPFSAPALGALVLATINVVWVVLRFRETATDENRDQAQNDRRPYNPVKAMLHVELPGVNRVNLVFFVYTFAFTGMEFTLTFLARDRFDYSAAKNALLFIFVGFIIALVQGGVVRKVAPRFGEKRVSVFGLFLVVPGLALVGGAGTEPMMYAGLGLLSFGSALTTPSLTALVSLYTPGARQGEVLGIFRSLGSLARAIGPLVACLIYWRFGSEWPYFAAAALLAVPMALALALPSPHPESVPASEA